MKYHYQHSSRNFDWRYINLLLFVGVLSLVDLRASAQDYILILQKRNHTRNAYYKPGDELIFYRKGRREKIRDQIISINDSTLSFAGYEVPLKEITALHIDQKTKWWLRFKAAQVLLIAGTGYIAIDAFNQKKFDRQTLLIGGSMIVGGIICKILIPNKIKLKRNVRLRIIRK